MSRATTNKDILEILNERNLVRLNTILLQLLERHLGCNACTNDTCDDVGCKYTEISCDDDNACTIDLCNNLNFLDAIIKLFNAILEMPVLLRLVILK